MKTLSVFAILILMVVALGLRKSPDRQLVKQLPTIIQLREYLAAHQNHVEGHPDMILSAAKPISQVFKAGKNSRQNQTYAFSYFKDCAEEKTIVHSVRAVCFQRYQELLKLTQNQDHLTLPVIDSEVQRIISQL